MAKKIKVQTRCPECGCINEVEVYPQDLADYRSGRKHPQDAFPYLSPDERETLITGICPACWDKLFPDEEDDE